jgi:hypothetical protein
LNIEKVETVVVFFFFRNGVFPMALAIEDSIFVGLMKKISSWH